MTTPQPIQPPNDLPKLSQPALRALTQAKLVTLKQISKLSESKIKKLHGVGPNAITQLRAALKAKGLAFAPDKKK